MPECTCHGANPECCYCGGWGWIGDRVCPKEQALHAGITVRPGPDQKMLNLILASKARPRPVKTPCPICGKRKVNVRDHMNAVHKGAA